MENRNYRETLLEVNRVIKGYHINNEEAYAKLNNYVWQKKEPFVLSIEGSIDYYAYYAMQNFCLFMDKCKDKHFKGLSLKKIERELKRYWTKNYNKFSL